MSLFAETALQIAAMCFYYLAGFATFMSGAFFVWIWKCSKVVTRLKSKTLVECIYEGFEWCHRESNQGHKDFQSFALPTEL